MGNEKMSDKKTNNEKTNNGKINDGLTTEEFFEKYGKSDQLHVFYGLASGALDIVCEKVSTNEELYWCALRCRFREEDKRFALDQMVAIMRDELGVEVRVVNTRGKQTWVTFLDWASCEEDTVEIVVPIIQAFGDTDSKMYRATLDYVFAREEESKAGKKFREMLV